MHEKLCTFDYAIIRVVPKVHREEFINAGVVLFSSERGYLGSRVYVDEPRLRALSADIDIPLVRRHLQAIPRICAGGH